MPSSLNAPQLQNEKAAFAYVEARVWPNGPVCPHCGNGERIYAIRSKPEAKAKVRYGLKKCGACRKQFTVRIGTVFQSSHVPLYIWLQAIALACSSTKGVSSNQLSRVLGVTVKTACFMSHRIRDAMRSGDITPFGGEGTPVEVDETYMGTIHGALECGHCTESTRTSPQASDGHRRADQLVGAPKDAEDFGRRA